MSQDSNSSNAALKEALAKMSETLSAILPKDGEGKEKTELASAKTSEGAVVEAEAFEVGQPIFVVSEDGERTPAPDGDHQLEDGPLVVVADGKIAEIKPMESDDDEGEELKKQYEEMKSALEQTKEQLSAAQTALEAKETELSALKEAQESMSAQLSAVTEKSNAQEEALKTLQEQLEAAAESTHFSPSGNGVFKQEAPIDTKGLDTADVVALRTANLNFK